MMDSFTRKLFQKISLMSTSMMNVSTRNTEFPKLKYTSTNFQHLFLVLYLNYYLNTTQSRRKRNDDVFDDISLNNKPQLQFTCKYDRELNVNSELTVASTSTPSEDHVSRLGFLVYEATVKDVKIGRDHFTEVLITPKHHLTNIYAV